MENQRIISSDSHIMEPADLWTSRIEPKWRDRAPHVVRMDDADWWFCDGFRGMSFGAAIGDGTRFDDPEKLSYRDRVENVRPGAYDPDAHVKDMDIDGVDVGFIYPTNSLFAFSLPDAELLTPVFKTYNDWLAEFCQAHPKRLKGIGMLNVDFVDSAVKELERCAKLGLPGAMIAVFPTAGKPYDLPEYEPLWDAAVDLGIPLSLHTGTIRPAPGGQVLHVEELMPESLCTKDYYAKWTLAKMIFGGVFERHPKLQVGAIEFELSWAIYFLNRMDDAWTQKPHGDYWYRFKEDMFPSDYFHRNVFLGVQEDAEGIRNRAFIGVDNIQWGSDYPHMESTFPRSREILAEILVDCSEEEKSKIVGANAARVYNL